MSSKNESNTDFVGSEHWDSIWKKVKKRNVSRLNYYNSILIDLFSKNLKPGSRFLEVGCGGSIWLPYLAKKHSIEAWGVDYSESGIERSREADKKNGTKSRLVLADIFKENELPDNYFDVIWSNGFIEHFSDPTAVIKRVKKYLKDDGVIITMVPNMTGFAGLIQKLVDHETYQNHQKIDSSWLDQLHSDAGLTSVMKARYSGIFSLGVVNYLAFIKQPILYKLFMTALSLFQQLVLLPLRLLRIDLNTSYFSPYVVAVYKKN